MAVADNIPLINRNKYELQLNVWLLPFLAGLFAVLYIISGFRGWLTFFVGLAAVWLLALLWVLSLKKNLRIERHLHLAWATVGDSIQEELILVNEGWLPALWLEISDTSPALSTPVRLVSDIGSRSSRRRYLSHQYKQRGLYTLGPTRLRTSDPFGIYTLTIFDYHSDTILVTPPLLPMNKIWIAPAGWAGDNQPVRSALERVISDAGVRDYQPGDSLRRIHWPASAHFDQLIVRQLAASTSGDWWIFVDLDARVQAGEGQDSTIELIIVVAASLAIRRLKGKQRVGLALSGPDLVWIEPSADLTHSWRILKSLAVARVGETPLADLVRIRHPVQSATMIAVTSSTDPDWIGVTGSRGTGGRFVALVDPAEFGSPMDQSRVISALALSGIPFHQMSRSLLKDAYPSIRKGIGRPTGDTHPGKRYLKDGRTTWQQMG